MKSPIRLAVLAAASMAAASASAQVYVNVDGTEYELETVSTSLNSIAAGDTSLLPWWGNQVLAQTFASAYSTAVGNGNQTAIFPISNGFSANEVIETYSGGQWTQSLNTGDPAATQALIEDHVLVVAVPEASTWVAAALLALPFGMQGMRQIRKSRQVA